MITASTYQGYERPGRQPITIEPAVAVDPAAATDPATEPQVDITITEPTLDERLERLVNELPEEDAAELQTKYGNLGTDTEKSAFLEGYEAGRLANGNEPTTAEPESLTLDQRLDRVLQNERVVPEMAGELREQYNALPNDEQREEFLDTLEGVLGITQEQDPIDITTDQTLTEDQRRLLELIEAVGPEKAREMLLLERMNKDLAELRNRVTDEYYSAQNNPFLRIARGFFQVENNEKLLNVLGRMLLDSGVLAAATTVDILTGRMLLDRLDPVLRRFNIDVSQDSHGNPTNEFHTELVKWLLDKSTDMLMGYAANATTKALSKADIRRQLESLDYTEEDIKFYMDRYHNGKYVGPLAGIVGSVGGMGRVNIPGTRLEVREVISALGVQSLANIINRTPLAGNPIGRGLKRLDAWLKKHEIVAGVANIAGGVGGMVGFNILKQRTTPAPATP